MTMQKLDATLIGQKLRTLRGARPQKEVADALGVTTMAISSYENGERIPRDEIKIALARYYETTVESIFLATSKRFACYGAGTPET